MKVAPILHIVIDDKGIARIAGARFKVTFLAVERTAFGWTPEYIQEQHPHLTTGQIHAALSHYFDHKAELDEQIAAADRFAEQMIREHPNRLTRAVLEERLRAKRDREQS